MTDYLTMAEVVAIHDDLIERYGGAGGLRDAGALDAALFRPQSGYYKDIIQEAAALWESLGQNHPFIDGNKRTAFATAFTFLRVNGLSIESKPLQIFQFIDGLYQANSFRLEHLDRWLREHIRPMP
jgi:death-on-curing protein